jgi:ketosteroid isomerase-like protein
MTETRIRQLAAELDEAIEQHDVDKVVTFFSQDCEIETIGLTLKGHDGARKWMSWLVAQLPNISFKPRVILVQGNLLIEEYAALTKTEDGTDIESKQCEVLEYENDKLKSLRIYFDRLDFAEYTAKNWFQKAVVRRMIRISTEELS